MTKEEVFKNRKDVAKKLVKEIRQNGYMKNLIYLIKRPYHDVENGKKFSAANYMRILASDSGILQKCDPRWYTVEEIQNNNWKLKENAEAVELEEWTETEEKVQECKMQKYYNAADVDGKEKYPLQRKTLEKVLKSLQMKRLLEASNGIMSLNDAVSAVGKYSANSGGDELTNILVEQVWLVESGIETKIKAYLPMYSEEVIKEIEGTPEKIIVSLKKAQEIIKELKKEKTQPLTKDESSDKYFRELQVIYHGREQKLKDSEGIDYEEEAIMRGETAYEFLAMLKKSGEEKIKTWLEISYKDYNHGKIMVESAAEEIGKWTMVSEAIGNRLDRNRQELMKAGLSETELVKVKFESAKCRRAMKEMQEEELKYMAENPEIKIII